MNNNNKKMMTKPNTNLLIRIDWIYKYYKLNGIGNIDINHIL